MQPPALRRTITSGISTAGQALDGLEGRAYGRHGPFARAEIIAGLRNGRHELV